MARPEAPVDRTVKARAELADFLRARRKSAGLTYRTMSQLVGGTTSKTTFERAASGTTVPTLDTVEKYVHLTITLEEEFTGSIDIALNRARKLWLNARRATRGRYYLHKAPDPALISNAADFSRALRDQHTWAGCPTSGEMARMSGPGMLPKTTAHRIITGRSLPVTALQAVAFLKACYVTAPDDLEPWLAAAIRVFPAQYDWAHEYIRVQHQIIKNRAPAYPLEAVA
ncbi:helix-turn-helix domain-containing protein [Streptomyces seoulensis]